ncbi:MAG: hypothetical protein ABIQ16_11110, partial [Polyangiaceae bacterium]
MGDEARSFREPDYGRPNDSGDGRHELAVSTRIASARPAGENDGNTPGQQVPAALRASWGRHSRRC